jgi:hypothetical protein
MNELAFDMKQKYNDFDVTSQHLGQIVRDNNKTRKRTRHEHFHNQRYKKPIDKQTELDKTDKPTFVIFSNAVLRYIKSAI